jgi:hypothetical protein
MIKPANEDNGMSQVSWYILTLHSRKYGPNDKSFSYLSLSFLIWKMKNLNDLSEDTSKTKTYRI